MEQNQPCLSTRRSWFPSPTRSSWRPTHTHVTISKLSSLIRGCPLTQETGCAGQLQCDMELDQAPVTGPCGSSLGQVTSARACPRKMWTQNSLMFCVVVSLCILMSLSVASAAVVECPQECVCSNVDFQRLGSGAMFGNTKEPQGALAAINCSGAGLTQLRLYLPVELDYESANNSSARDDTGQEVAVTPILQFLDLSHNQLVSAEPKIELLQVSQNSTCTPVVKTTALDLSHNFIAEVKSQDLAAYKGVKSIDMSYNGLQWVGSDAFLGLEVVVDLNLSHNAIQDLANGTFRSQVNLLVLDLSHNHLHVFLLEQLQELSSLQYLYLNDNNLHPVTTSTTCAFPALPSLVFLNLADNPLMQITHGMFSSLPALVTLDLTNCSLQDLSENSLAGLQSLEDLHLDHNDISTIAGPIFQHTALKQLSITFMPNLDNISHDAFLGLSELMSLNLSHNPQFSFLQPNLLAPLDSLRTLDLSDSSLSQVSEITFHHNTELTHVHLENNPLSCSCINAWLVSETMDNHTKFTDVSSQSCLHKNGTTAALRDAGILCEDIRIYNMTPEVSAKLGAQLLLKCQYDTNEPSIVKWTTPRGITFQHHHFHQQASQHLLTPKDIQLESTFHKSHYWHHSSSYHSELDDLKDRVILLSDGSLYIDYMLRSDTGHYRCQVSNAVYNHSSMVNLLVDCNISSDVKIFGYVAGLLSALGFFTLNVIYVIISWIARRLVNKRRREIIRQMLENLNAYKSTQITRIHENYTYQLSRVRNQYHIQRDKLHRNYTCQVARMKRGCSNQVERVRDNYNSKLNQLRDYSSNQIVQIRERANNQIVRIRDYGSTQLDKLRETYKLQQQHVLKLLDTMNLDNCRHVVETECMRAESMMYDIDLLGDDDRTDSPVSTGESDYNTAATSTPGSSPEDHDVAGLKSVISQQEREPSTDSSESNDIIIEMQTTIDLEGGLAVDVADSWKYDDVMDNYNSEKGHEYSMNIRSTDGRENESLFQLRSDPTLFALDDRPRRIKHAAPLPKFHLNIAETAEPASGALSNTQNMQHLPDNISNIDGYMTPEASPTRTWSPGRGLPGPQYIDRGEHGPSADQVYDVTLIQDTESRSSETIV